MCNREAYRANRKQSQILDMAAPTQFLNSPSSSHLILHCKGGKLTDQRFAHVAN